jgi:hypothetical protein
MIPSTVLHDHSQRDLTLPERPLALTLSLFLRDFLHETGQSVGLLTIMERNLGAGPGVDDDPAGSYPDPDWCQRFKTALSELRDGYAHYRAIGTVSPPTLSAHDQWQTLARRVLHLMQPSAARAAATIRFIKPPMVDGESGDLAALELVVLCFLKETLDRRPAGAPATFVIKPTPDGQLVNGKPRAAVNIAVYSDSLAIALSEPAVASLVARRLGLVVTLAPDGQSIRVAQDTVTSY